MKKLLNLFMLGVLCAILVAGLGFAPAGATRLSGWTPDARVPGYLDDTFTPFLLADRNRTVHAFASQWVENEGRRLAIVYRQWTLLGGWTRPVDILLSPVGGSANFVGAYLDSSDRLHVIFMATEALTRRTFVYYSSAPAASADWAPSWSALTSLADDGLGLNAGAITGDDQGNLVVIYSGNRDGSGVYSVHSKNSGMDWSIPEPVFLTYDNNLSSFSLRLTTSPQQKIRATWNVVTNLGVDDALYFANFNTANSKWDPAVELDERIDLPEYFGPSYPVIVDNGREVIVFYNGGNPLSGRPVGPGRPIQRANISLDGGVTWSEPLDPFPFHIGRSGEHTMVLDANEIPHVLFVQRIESLDEKGRYTIIGGIWHSRFENGAWTNPDRLVTLLAPHDVRAVVVQGNVLLVVWREDPGVGQGGIWYSYSILDIPELPVTPLATVPADVAGLATTSGAVFELGTPQPTLAPEQLSNPEQIPSLELLDEAPPSDLGRNPALPVIIGTVPVILILIGVIVGYRFLASRRE